VQLGLKGIGCLRPDLRNTFHLAVAPVTEIRLDSFVYDPNAKSGNVVVNAAEGAFRFITGLQASQNYSIRTPFATLGVAPNSLS